MEKEKLLLTAFKLSGIKYVFLALFYNCNWEEKNPQTGFFGVKQQLSFQIITVFIAFFR